MKIYVSIPCKAVKRSFEFQGQFIEFLRTLSVRYVQTAGQSQTAGSECDAMTRVSRRRLRPRWHVWSPRCEVVGEVRPLRLVLSARSHRPERPREVSTEQPLNQVTAGAMSRPGLAAPQPLNTPRLSLRLTTQRHCPTTTTWPVLQSRRCSSACWAWPAWGSTRLPRILACPRSPRTVAVTAREPRTAAPPSHGASSETPRAPTSARGWPSF